MYAAHRTPSILDDRLSADFYAPTYIEIETMITNCGVEPIRLGSKLDRVFKGAFYLLASEYVESGIPFIRVTQIASGNLDLSSTVYLTQEAHHRERKTAVRSGNLLFAKGGVYRHCAVIPSTVLEANISQDLIGAVTSSDLDPHYAFSFLTSRFGRPQLIRWEQGDAQPHLSNDSVKHILMPFAAILAQQYVGEKVRQAERLRERAKRIDEEATLTLAAALGETPASWVANAGTAGVLSNGCFRTRVPSDLIRGRLDPSGYHPELRAIVDRARKCRSLFRPLCDVADVVTDTRDRTNEHSRIGAYISILHVDSDGFVDTAAAAGHRPESEGRVCQSGDILLSGINPAANRIGVCGESEYTLACSPEFSILAVRADIHPHYLAFALRSEPCFRQLIHLGQGTSSSRRRIDEAELQNLWIPIVINHDLIGTSLSNRQECLSFSELLSVCAKSLVEALVEGKITEVELVNAQQALDRGDQSFDRAILSRLTEDGIGVAGKPPLFPDLDALYAAIDEAQRTQSSNGDAA